jgi:hypothetical protein
MAPGSLLFGELLSLIFLAAVGKTALVTGVVYVLFPELGALAYDVFVRPAGVWARAPLMLTLTPTAAAVIGTTIARTMPFGFAATALCIAAAMLLIRVLRSPIAPAISAGFLAVSLNVTSWWYPVSIAASTGLLALGCIIYRRMLPDHLVPTASREDDAIDDELERTPQRYTWVPVFAGFLLVVYALSALTGLRLILFPPLVVIAFEMFAHSDVCPWAHRPLTLPLACTITAAVGIAALTWFGAGPLSVSVALLAGVVTLRALRLHMPPALAIGLLPQVIPDVSWHFALSVAIGTLTLTGAFVFARPFLLSQSGLGKQV